MSSTFSMRLQDLLVIPLFRAQETLVSFFVKHANFANILDLEPNSWKKTKTLKN